MAERPSTGGLLSRETSEKRKEGMRVRKLSVVDGPFLSLFLLFFWEARERNRRLERLQLFLLPLSSFADVASRPARRDSNRSPHAPHPPARRGSEERQQERERETRRRRLLGQRFSFLKKREGALVLFSFSLLSLSLLCVMFADNIEVEAAYEEDAEISQVREGEEEKKDEGVDCIKVSTSSSVVKLMFLTALT